MEGPRGRSRVRSTSRYPRSMSVSRSRSASKSRSVSRARAPTGRIARAARAMLNQSTAGFLGLELKFFDTAIAAATISSAAAMTGAEMDPTALPSAVACLSAPAQGDGEQNRDGRKIILKSVLLNGDIQRTETEDAAGPPTAGQVLVALVLDTQTNGAQLNSEDVYKNLMATSRGVVSPVRNLLFGDRFRILRAECFNMDFKTLATDASDSHAGCGVSQKFNWFVPLEVPVNFNSGTTADVANVIDNSIHVIAFSSSQTFNCTLAYNARVRFMG